jgi:hypothetical protein
MNYQSSQKSAGKGRSSEIGSALVEVALLLSVVVLIAIASIKHIGIGTHNSIVHAADSFEVGAVGDHSRTVYPPGFG